MFGRDGGGDRDLSDIVESTQARRTRRSDLPCDFCGTEEGSVVYDRETEDAWCNKCFNDPECHEDDG